MTHVVEFDVVKSHVVNSDVVKSDVVLMLASLNHMSLRLRSAFGLASPCAHIFYRNICIADLRKTKRIS